MLIQSDPSFPNKFFIIQQEKIIYTVFQFFCYNVEMMLIHQKMQLIKYKDIN